MKKKLFLIIPLIVILSISLVILTGCGDSKVEEKNTNSANSDVDNKQNNQIKTEENQDDQVNTEKEIPSNAKKRTIDAWFNLPENLDYFMESSYSDGTTSSQHISKRGNNFLLNLGGHYYFYKYTGDYIWTSFEYIDGKGWDTHYLKGCVISGSSTSEDRMFKKLDSYTTEHEKFNVEGVGEVDTVIGKDGDDIYYYSQDLDINVKVITTNITLIVTKFDKNVTDFPHSIPDNME